MTATRPSTISSRRSTRASASRFAASGATRSTGGLEIETLTGRALEPRHWDAFFRFYMSTSDRKWGSAYLTREFFDLLRARMADEGRAGDGEARAARYVAGALNLIGSDTLYGRNWGCLGDFPFLHFEACYYRAIDFAIAHGLKRVEAGAQGQHKIQRGYLPCPPTAPTGSATRVFGAPSRNSWTASAAPSSTRWKRSKRRCRRSSARRRGEFNLCTSEGGAA